MQPFAGHRKRVGGSGTGSPNGSAYPSDEARSLAAWLDRAAFLLALRFRACVVPIAADPAAGLDDARFDVGLPLRTACALGAVEILAFRPSFTVAPFVPLRVAMLDPPSP